jgi:hypothetical protein
MGYINIPDTLLKLSDKEIETELKKTTFPTNWYIDENGRIVRFYTRIKNVIFFYEDNKLHKETADSFSYYFRPLNISKFKLIKKDNILYGLAKQTSKSFIKYLTKYVSEIYPIENFDIEEICKDAVSLIIYYPEITIKNSIELSHTIKDVYLKYIFARNGDYGFILEEILLAKTSVFLKELSKNYLHSHVSNRGIGKYSDSFCFGDTDIKEFVRTCKRKNTKIMNYIQQLLLNIEEFLTWESIEGGPYGLIQDLQVNLGKYKIYNDSAINKSKKDLINALLQNSNFRLRYTFNLTDKFNIKLTQDTIEIIDNILSKICDTEYLYYRIDNKSCILNGYYRNNIAENGKTSDVIFKGERKFIKILDLEKTSFEEEPPKKSIFKF